jgi:hypothetical protein
MVVPYLKQGYWLEQFHCDFVFDLSFVSIFYRAAQVLCQFA